MFNASKLANKQTNQPTNYPTNQPPSTPLNTLTCTHLTSTRPSEANDASFSDFFIFHFLASFSFFHSPRPSFLSSLFFPGPALSKSFRIGKSPFSAILTKALRTDRPTYQWTSPLTEMQTHLKKILLNKRKWINFLKSERKGISGKKYHLVQDLTNRKLRIRSCDPLDQSYSRNMDFEPSIRKVPLLLNSVNIDGMLVKFLLKNDVDHRISSETFVYRPNRPFLFPLNTHPYLYLLWLLLQMFKKNLENAPTSPLTCLRRLSSPCWKNVHLSDNWRKKTLKNYC